MDEQPVIAAVIKVGPPVAISASTVFFGVQLDAWVIIITIAYALLQTGFLLYDRIKKRGRK